MTTKKLVRLWEHQTWNEVASDFVHWHNGFQVDVRHQLAQRLIAAEQLVDWTVTVYSTDELIWKVDHWTLEDDRFKVRCVPYLQVIRQALKSDDALIDAYLTAERQFYTDSVAELRRVRAELAQAQEGASMWDAVTNMFGRMR